MGDPALWVLLRLKHGCLGAGAESPALSPHDIWARVARSCLYLRHLTAILNASKCHYTVL